MRRRLSGILCGFLVVALVGCGKKQVEYEEGVQTTAEEEAMADGSLSEKLGIGEKYVWEETIGEGKNAIDLHVYIKIPEAAQMYALKADKHYYTNEEKKKLAEFFMEPDSIKVDKELFPTKENIQRRIDDYDEIIESDKEMGIENEEQAMSYRYEQERLRELLNKAPDENEVDENPGDYSGNYYKGVKNGMEYNLTFYKDEERNRSAWDLDVFSPEDGDILVTQIGTDGSEAVHITKEDAENQALKLCEELGMPGMAVVNITDCAWMFDSDREINGYSVELARSIDGVPVDNRLYFEDTKYLDGVTTKLPYSTEKVEIGISDMGIFNVMYKGIMTKGEMGNPVKLLKIDQIKDVIREELKKNPLPEGMSYEGLELEYIRIADETNPDSFCYIPVWRLSTMMEADLSIFGGSLDQTIWINAIDGNIIDLEAQGGAITYMNAQGLGDYE